MYGLSFKDCGWHQDLFTDFQGEATEEGPILFIRWTVRERRSKGACREGTKKGHAFQSRRSEQSFQDTWVTHAVILHLSCSMQPFSRYWLHAIAFLQVFDDVWPLIEQCIYFVHFMKHYCRLPSEHSCVQTSRSLIFFSVICEGLGFCFEFLTPDNYILKVAGMSHYNWVTVFLYQFHVLSHTFISIMLCSYDLLFCPMFWVDLPCVGS